MPTAAQLYQSNNPRLAGAEIIPAQNSLLVGGCTTAQIANCVDPFYATRTVVARAAANNVVTDKSGNAMTLTTNNITTTNVGSIQDGYCFVGSAASSGVYCTSTGAATLLTGDYTIELWYWVPPTAGYALCLWGTQNGNSTTGISLQFASATTVGLYYGVSSTYACTSNVTAQAWNHIAMVRADGNALMYVNGITNGSAYAATTSYTDVNNLYIGNLSGLAAAPVGYRISGFRLSKFAQYKANFTPPTTPFPVIA